MSEFIGQVDDNVDCQVRNCKIGVVYHCSAYELREALKYGKSDVNCRANRDGCSVFSEEKAKIFYDSEGNAIDYELPYTDPNTKLKFTVMATLVKYGTDPQNLFIGTSNTADEGGEWSELRQSFNDLVHSTFQINRRLFPPNPIIIDGNSYEVAAIAICENRKCAEYAGEINISPLPLITK